MRQLLLAKVAFPMLELLSRSNFWSIYKEINRLHTADFDSRDEHQRDKLASLLSWAGSEVDFWRNAFNERGIKPAQVNADNAKTTLQRLPITTKSDYSNGFPDRITAINHQNDWQYLSSAGTTDRMTVVTDFLKRDYLRAAEHLNLYYAMGHPVGRLGIDIPPHACNVVCGLADEGPEPIPQFIWWSAKNRALLKPSTMSDLRGRVERQIIQKRQTLLPINPGPWDKMRGQLDEYLDIVVNEKIEVLRGLPQFLLWLAKRAEERSLSFPHIRAILPYGGLTGERIITLLSRVFSAPFINVYGTGEVGAIGCSDSDNTAIKPYQSLIYLEILDQNDHPVEPGETGRIVVTDLTNHAMPIIRYEIGDIGTLVQAEGPDQQPCEVRILGRRQECLRTPDGEWVSTATLQDIFYKYDHILNFKLQHLYDDCYKASIMTRGPVDKVALAKELGELPALSEPPAIKEVPFIPPESSGKYLALKTKKAATYA